MRSTTTQRLRMCSGKPAVTTSIDAVIREVELAVADSISSGRGAVAAVMRERYSAIGNGAVIVDPTLTAQNICASGLLSVEEAREEIARRSTSPSAVQAGEGCLLSRAARSTTRRIRQWTAALYRSTSPRSEGRPQ